MPGTTHAIVRTHTHTYHTLRLFIHSEHILLPVQQVAFQISLAANRNRRNQLSALAIRTEGIAPCRRVGGSRYLDTAPSNMSIRAITVDLALGAPKHGFNERAEAAIQSSINMLLIRRPGRTDITRIAMVRAGDPHERC
jgi:hypothetical protein